MRPYFLILIPILLAACAKSGSADDTDLQHLYATLDAEIAKSKVYEAQKEQKLVILRKDFDLAHDSDVRTDIINRLIEEFDAYNADSALFYISYNLRRPAVIANPKEYNRMLIKRADVYAHAGLFSDALDTMLEVDRGNLDNSLLEDYYSTYCAIYQYLSEYTSEHETSNAYEHRRAQYADSLNRVVDPESFLHMIYVMSEKARKGQADQAINVLSKHLEEYPSGSRQYSILASTLAYIYKTSGYNEESKRHLVLSAISDVQGAVKENVSFREVATVMYEDGDIERANRYLKKSIADATFYSALLRNAQSSKMLPVIDEAYSSQQERMTGRMRTMVWVSSILSAVLLITIMLILKQFRSLRRAHDKINRVNAELSEMSQQLKDANIELEQRNNELRDFNKTKEQYAGLFMEYCSSAIFTLQHYQQSLRNLTAQGANRNQLLKKLESTEIADQLLKNFYVKFDEAILSIYPAFVDKFNSLLNDADRVVLKPGELLNTELRLFALIRLGIDDSNKIAEFLRCSISTVYTYRSKMRKRAKNPASFEEDIRAMI